MLDTDTQDREGCKYVHLLLQDKQRELRTLEVRHQQMLICTEDYMSCRRSLLQAVAQLEELILTCSHR
jgi:hypothetical protein